MWPTHIDTNVQQNALKFQLCGYDDDNPSVTFDNMYICFQNKLSVSHVQSRLQWWSVTSLDELAKSHSMWWGS